MADLVPAAQYLRISTDHQQYSIENQAVCIQRYTASKGFEIVKTYVDSGKSGVSLHHRLGLRQLLKDVVEGDAQYQTVLVYDISRWGRFQDSDEAAHYEFLCKSAGVPIHYCAEAFPNDGSVPSLVLKTLKRVMAGEYSRELSEKVIAGQKKIAQLGFKMGGLPSFGYRRMLISVNGMPKQLLQRGDRKSLANDRVILVRGPEQEVELVNEIFQMFT
jgi:DNA invertase Pin-like site-specific DNA recombinase